MADITTVWDETNGDWVLLGASLESGNDLQTAVLISLFSDRLASPDDTIPDAPQSGPADPRGWWGDAYSDRPIGSKLWLYARAKETAATLVAVENAITVALQWLLDDGVAAAIDVDAEWLGPGFLGAAVEIFKVDGSRASAGFRWAWDGVS
jgi:phage gp46-like protein